MRMHYSMGTPDAPDLPFMEKLYFLETQDAALANARFVGGFVDRQLAQGFRLALAPKVPEGHLGVVVSRSA